MNSVVAHFKPLKVAFSDVGTNAATSLGAQWLRFETEGSRVRASPASLRCVPEQEH